jgi:hypothetical protein
MTVTCYGKTIGVDGVTKGLAEPQADTRLFSHATRRHGGRLNLVVGTERSSLVLVNDRPYKEKKVGEERRPGRGTLLVSRVVGKNGVFQPIAMLLLASGACGLCRGGES